MMVSERIVGVRGSQGATLLEVMVALVLLALLVVPIARGIDSAVNGASSVRAKAQEVAEGSGSSGIAQAWEWGPVLTTAAWRPGPTLDVAIKVRRDTACAVGLWCNGWSLGEREVDPEGRVCVQASDLHELADGELLVRVREAGGTWGPPWRSIVPDSTGVFSSLDAACDASDVILGMEPLPRAVVHASALANPNLEVSPECGGLEAAYPGLTFCVPGCTKGWLRADLEGRVQFWLTGEGRALDVYF
ncbi:MAG: prepilin-type N-terminal cleavage/methylation domain-containing protein [Thermoleophilia bacterium]|nr:prepilin-type N-terminal cleavage/methylation domain-containing protein [Thermoleophilia bacterium]